jgi:phospholipid-binding lipoprotein MlaA
MMRPLTNHLAVLFATTMLAACAAMPADPDERADFVEANDPLEPMNRAVFDMNMYLDDHVMAPVARTYRDETPEPVKASVHNVLTNLSEPYVAGNDLLQGNPQRAADSLGRFLINSTWGLFGLFDRVGDTGGPRAHENDIGVTLGVWGVDEGPYLMLPFVGPSNPRDTAGRVADLWASPASAVFAANGIGWISDAQFGVDLVDSRTQLLDPLDEVKRSSIDLYAAIRSLYRQRRAALVTGAGQDQPVPASLPAAVPPSQAPARPVFTK